MDPFVSFPFVRTFICFPPIFIPPGNGCREASRQASMRPWGRLDGRAGSMSGSEGSNKGINVNRGLQLSFVAKGTDD